MSACVFAKIAVISGKYNKKSPVQRDSTEQGKGGQ